MDILAIVFTALLGLTFGSFATVLTHRLPQGQSLSNPLSYCPKCKSSIRNVDKFPLLSFVLLHGRCRNCKSKIDIRYAIIEVSTMALFIVALFQSKSMIGTIALFSLATLTMPLIYIDFQYKRLPNSLTYTGISLGLILASATSFIEKNFSPLIYAVTCMFIPSLFFFILHLISRGGMGMGDVKLAGMLGVLLFQMPASTLIAGLFLAFFLGASTGIILILMNKATRKTAIPFGPFMLIGIWISIAMSAELEQFSEIFF
jgi:leader peptidase (prepilin peptidase)/N-methyltransferase